MGANLITKAEYKAYMGLNGTNEDAKIDNLIPKVSQFIKSYCRQTFIDNVDEPLIERTDGGLNYLNLSTYPVINVLSVEYSNDFGATYTAMTEFVDYTVDKKNAMIFSTRGEFTKKLNGYRVMYTCGYDELPLDLKLAVFDMITYYRQNDSAVHSNKAPGSNTVQIEYIRTNSLPAHMARILDLYVTDYS